MMKVFGKEILSETSLQYGKKFATLELLKNITILHTRLQFTRYANRFLLNYPAFLLGNIPKLTGSLISINITQESVNKTADKKLWDKEIQREMAEHRERHFANREVEIKKYEQDLQIWKDVNRKYIGACYCLRILFNLQAKII